MPVGRFREDPREQDEVSRRVSARQIPEGWHVLGSLLGLALPHIVGVIAPGAPALLRSPIASILGLVVFGIGGYLLGHRYARRVEAALGSAGPGGE